MIIAWDDSNKEITGGLADLLLENESSAIFYDSSLHGLSLLGIGHYYQGKHLIGIKAPLKEEMVLRGRVFYPQDFGELLQFPVGRLYRYVGRSAGQIIEDFKQKGYTFSNEGGSFRIPAFSGLSSLLGAGPSNHPLRA